jgi:CRISPR-associated protein Csb2
MFAIQVEFLMGRAVATQVGERNEAEWPPHPQRLFSALVAAQSELELGVAGRAALMWLEKLPAPEIRADLSPSYRQAHSHWVPVNDEVIKLEKGRADFRHPLERRNRQERFFPAVVPSDPVVTFQWRCGEGLEQHRETLNRLVESLTYVGHSASPVRACLKDEAVEPTLVPSEDGDYSFRVPGPGRFDRLESTHQLRLQDENAQAPLGRVAPYAAAVEQPHTVFSPRAVVLAFDSGPRLGLDSSLPLMQHVRNALLARLSTPMPASLTGHETDGRPAQDPHAAFVPLGFVNHKYADGSLKGVAVVLPRALDERVRRALRAAVDPPWLLHLGPLGSLILRVVEDPSAELRALQFHHYTRSHSVWATVTPIVLDRHPKKNGPTAQSIIEESCKRIGLPPPMQIRLGAISPVAGSPGTQEFHGQAKQTNGRIRTHALLQFPEPILGPLLLGAGRFTGLGLCLPFGERGPL